MTLKERIDKFFNGIIFVQKKITACLLLLMIVMVSMQVIGRFLHAKFPWTEEITNYSLIWLTYIGSIGVLIKGEHLTVDLFLVRYTPRQKQIATLLINLVNLLFCLMLFVFGVKLVLNPLIINSRTPALAISRVWIYASLPISMFFNALYCLYASIKSIIGIKNEGRPKGTYIASKEEAL